MFTSKVLTDDIRLLQESNLAARQRQGATSVIQAITGEGLAQGPYVAARGGSEPTTFRTEGNDNRHLTNHAPMAVLKHRYLLEEENSSKMSLNVGNTITTNISPTPTQRKPTPSTETNTTTNTTNSNAKILHLPQVLLLWP